MVCRSCAWACCRPHPCLDLVVRTLPWAMDSWVRGVDLHSALLFMGRLALLSSILFASSIWRSMGFLKALVILILNWGLCSPWWWDVMCWTMGHVGFFLARFLRCSLPLQNPDLPVSPWYEATCYSTLQVWQVISYPTPGTLQPTLLAFLGERLVQGKQSVEPHSMVGQGYALVRMGDMVCPLLSTNRGKTCKNLENWTKMSKNMPICTITYKIIQKCAKTY